MKLIYQYRVKNSGGLAAKARAVNYVWNYANETQRLAVSRGRKWLSGFDLTYLTAGSSKELGLGANTITEICKTYAKSRIQQNRPWLRWRGKKSLGWVPFRGPDVRQMADGFKVYGKTYRVFESRPLPPGKIKDGSSFSQDAKGNWYLNICIEVADAPARSGEAVGIDLGLKDTAALSTGDKIPARQFYRRTEERLAMAQRGRKKQLVKRIHAKIANQRKDFLHKETTKIVRRFSHIYVGNVSSSGLAKTNMAKSVSDAGWYSFKQMLAYKSIKNGATYREVNERFSTQTCSQCESIGGPKGYAGLNERDWVCVHCGASHDRDGNAASNILRWGHPTPVQGIPA